MKKIISFVLAVSMIMSIFASALVFSADETGIIAGTNGQTAGNKNNLYAHDKTATPLYKNDYTDVTLTVGGDQRELTSDIVLIIGHRPTENITYMTDLINR
ncbi:MAG: hypothetical protein IIW31_01530, partial [Clostridia bacterium]|nr:hypothetical protein [Clostridia bacterium]